MPLKKVLVISGGCYAVNEDGMTVELKQGQEALIEDAQAAVFVRSNKAQLVVNVPAVEKQTQQNRKHKR